MGKLLLNENNAQASNQVGKSGIGVGGLLFIVLFVIKLTEKCSFWNGSFPDWLRSTDRWWDGWFLVFLPLWAPLVIVIGIILVVFIIALIITVLKG